MRRNNKDSEAIDLARLIGSVFGLFIGIAWVESIKRVALGDFQWYLMNYSFETIGWLKWLLIFVDAIFAGIFIHCYKVVLHSWAEAETSLQGGTAAIRNSLWFLASFVVPILITASVIKDLWPLFVFGLIVVVQWLYLIHRESGSFSVTWKPQRRYVP